jgi:hypothetical protein
MGVLSLILDSLMFKRLTEFHFEHIVIHLALACDILNHRGSNLVYARRIIWNNSGNASAEPS